MIETEVLKPHEFFNRYIEARHELRQHSELEATLIERMNSLPEDDFCHFARESFQLGAGYSYMQRDNELELNDVLAGFFATRPRNRYADPETVAVERKTIATAALELLESRIMPGLEPHIDPYEVEAASAFTEGYVVSSRFLKN